MKPELLEVYIDSAIMLADLKNPTHQEISDSIQRNFGITVSVAEIENFYTFEVQDKIAQTKALGIYY